MTQLHYEAPPAHHVRDLAPRVEGANHRDYVGHYGYALCLTSGGRVLVLWDEERGDQLTEDVNPIYLVFLRSRS